MVKRELAESVMEISRISPRIVFVHLLLCGKMVTVISVYGPQSGRSEEDKDSFLALKCNQKMAICIAVWEFSGTARSSINGYEGLYEG